MQILNSSSLFLFVLWALFLFSCSKSGYVQPSASEDTSLIEDIAGKKLTVNSFEKAYIRALDSFARTRNMDPEDFYLLVRSPETSLPPEYKNFQMQFNKPNFYLSYRQMLMVQADAEKSGFVGEAHTRKTLEHLRLQTAANYFLQEKINKSLNIQKEEAEKECSFIRQEKKTYKKIDNSICLAIGRTVVRQKKSGVVFSAYLNHLREGVSIEQNDSLDIENILRNLNRIGENKENPLLVRVGTREIRANDFINYYNTELTSFSDLQGVTENSLEVIANMKGREIPVEFQIYKEKFDRVSVFNNLKLFVMLQHYSEIENYNTRSDIRSLLDLSDLQTLTRMYLFHVAKQGIKISKADISTECKRLKATSEFYKSLSEKECNVLAESYLYQSEFEVKVPAVMRKITDRISIKHNEAFDLKAYLNKPVQ
ncbi:MAG: hypothetical protein H7A25_26220 [Leptospiraceae bacterium]|nr:hypothetical protein [Leptospiraceae bacterium]